VTYASIRDHVVVDDVSMEVAPRVSPSSAERAGKSTLLRCINCWSGRLRDITVGA